MTAELPGEGSAAPDFELPSDDGQQIRLSSLKGKWVVLFFYPKALTPGCTTEACGFRDAYAELQDLGAEVLGLSHDPIPKLQKFREKNGLTFPLLSDVEHEATTAYGVYGLKKFMGREYMGIKRTTFLIDPEGRIAKVWKQVRVKDHVDEVLSELKGRRAG